jgi:hypothetical protein
MDFEYYGILGVSPNVSKHKAFRRFKRLFLQDGNSDSTLKELLTAHLLINGEGRKFLDLVILNKKDGKVPLEKYLAVIKKHRDIASTVIDDDSKRRQLTLALRSFPYKKTISEFASFAMEHLTTWMSWGFTFLFFACIAIYLSLTTNAWFLLKAIVLLVLGLLIIKRGINEIRIEEIKTICKL